MKAFRLAIVRQKYRPDGGAERFVSRALEALEQQDLDLNVITREWQGATNPNWHIHLCNPMKFGRISRERGFAEAARTLWQKEKFDLVQSHERIAGCDIYRAGDGVHRRWLLQRARLLPVWRRKWLFSNHYHRYVMCAERAMYAAPELKAVICNAEMIKQEIIDDFGVPADKINVIYNAIDNQKFLPANEQLRQSLRQQYQIPLQAHCLIFVGSGFERKGLAAAIRAIATTDSYLLVVGKDKAEKRYRALAQSLGCGERVRFMGVQKQTLPFYQAADALLLPTLYDPFPNVILEAMSCGLPVITSTTCGGAEFIISGQNGYVTDALDVITIAEAIRALPRRAEGSSMGEAARQRILSETPTHLSQQLLGLYQRLLSV
ncbi:glycosyltransferase family 4 protein [Serratia sp. NPDC078593]|uniref:glycosyltransferase family 4 protein n=1 Tax=unclassified Serratia (in: enterobacteria) TaxID=2647522 RepID=UPI0037D0DA04